MFVGLWLYFVNKMLNGVSIFNQLLHNCNFKLKFTENCEFIAYMLAFVGLIIVFSECWRGWLIHLFTKIY